MFLFDTILFNAKYHCPTDGEVCFDVDIEPSLQPISYEVLHYKTANTVDGARFYIAASNFSGKDRQ